MTLATPCHAEQVCTLLKITISCGLGEAYETCWFMLPGQWVLIGDYIEHTSFQVVSDAGEVQKALYPTTNVTNKHYDYDSSPMITPCDPDPRSMSVSCSLMSTHMLQHYQVKNKVRKRGKFIK